MRVQSLVRFSRIFFTFLVLFSAAGRRFVHAQTTGASFGEVVRLSGTPADILLDEARGRLYLVNQNANRVEVYDYNAKRLLTPIPVGLQPRAAAMSMDNAWLYVSNNSSSTLSVIDLGLGQVVNTVTLPGRPQGLAVGYDGRVLISTEGTGAGNTNNTLIVFDRTQTGPQLTPIAFPPAPPTPSILPATFSRPQAPYFSGKLERTPDGQFIVGVYNINNNTATVMFLYEVTSGVILKSRTVGGQSTVLTMSPDGSRFMAGFAMYETTTLSVLGQQTTANSPFPFPAGFNALQNVGGAVFTPDGGTLFSAFNTAPFTQPPARPNSAILLISDTRGLGLKLGIRIPESILAKMVMLADGSRAWGLSESGLVHLPLATLYDFPIIMPETNQVFLAQDECNRGVARATLRMSNLGKGRLAFSVPNTGAALISQVSSGLAPATITFTMDPGRSGVVRQPGTNLTTGNATLTGGPFNINIASPDAINIPNTIRVYMNYRTSDMRGTIAPIPTVLDGGQGLLDLEIDKKRELLYISNAGFNRIEVYNLKTRKLELPIAVCQLPRQTAISTDGDTMYVACAQAEGIGIIDLNQRAMVGAVEFPPIPRAGNAGVVSPRTLAVGLSGLQFLLTNGTLWQVIGNTAVPREPSPVIGITGAGAQQAVGGPAQMIGSPDFSQILLLSGTGVGYLYDALADAWTTSRQLFTNPLISYFGPLSISPDLSFMLANGLILNNSLTVIGGSERPGVIQTGPAPAPGQPPTQTVVSAGQRNVASVAAVDGQYYVRLTTPVRQAINSVTRDDVRTTLELVDITTGAESLLGVVPENPVSSVFGQQLSRVSPRLMTVDPKTATAYAITLSGLSVIPLVPATTATRPVVPNGVRGILNSSDASTNLRPGGFITVTGQNLATPANADQVPLPTVLGGSCVVFNDLPLPLIQVSPTQISAQIPDTLRPGLYVVQVRNLSVAQSSDPVVVNVLRPQ